VLWEDCVWISRGPVRISAVTCRQPRGDSRPAAVGLAARKVAFRRLRSRQGSSLAKRDGSKPHADGIEHRAGHCRRHSGRGGFANPHGFSLGRSMSSISASGTTGKVRMGQHSPSTLVTRARVGKLCCDFCRAPVGPRFPRPLPVFQLKQWAGRVRAGPAHEDGESDVMYRTRGEVYPALRTLQNAQRGSAREG
jgi:hypothetical protein